MNFITPDAQQLEIEERAATPELARFVKLFDQLMRQTFRFTDRIEKDEAYAHVPVESDFNFLGSRVNTITISTLMRHFMLAEAHWFEQLDAIADKGVIPFPDNASVLEGVKDGDALTGAYRDAYRRGRQTVLDYGEQTLEKEVSFAGRSYTVMGMLWTILGHHGFHLGQIDLLMRQQNIEPIEYMEWPREKGVIG